MPSLIETRSGIGETALHYLAVENRQDAVEWLHARGADLNTTNNFGTPLVFEVALLGYEGLFQWLTAHGADVNHRNADGLGMEEYLIESGKPAMVEFIRNTLGEPVNDPRNFLGSRTYPGRD